MNEIILQALYYFIVMVLSFFIVGFMQKGFFFKFVKVKLSFGKYILVKWRALNRDHYDVGFLEDGFLIVAKGKYESKRISITDNSVFYRVLGITTIDVEEETSNPYDRDMTQIPGFDAVKYNNLYVRALTRPSVNDQRDKIIFAGIVLISVLVIAVGFFVYQQTATIEGLKVLIQQSLSKGVIVAGT